MSCSISGKAVHSIGSVDTIGAINSIGPVDSIGSINSISPIGLMIYMKAIGVFHKLRCHLEIIVM